MTGGVKALKGARRILGAGLLVGISVLGLAQPSFAQSDPKTLVVAVPNDLQNLDPTLASSSQMTVEFLTNVYSWLINYKVDVGKDSITPYASDFVGGIAQSYEWNSAGTLVTFHLRPGLKFANGDPLDAKAVKFTFDRIFDQKGVTVGNMQQAGVMDKDSVVMVDPLTIQMKVSKPNTLLFGNMAQFGNSILNPKVVQPHMTGDDPYAHNWLAANTSGTEDGPFMLEKWTPGVEWSLVPNKNYYGDQPKLDRVIFKVIPDASSREAQLIRGDVDMAYDLPTLDIKTLQSNPDLTVHADKTRLVQYIGMNSKTPPFDNIKLRQAISYAVPYDTLINEVMNGFATPLKSPIPEGTPTHTDEFFAYKQDPEKAKALLKEAGFPNGLTATFSIPTGTQEAQDAAVYLQQSLAEIGIKINIEQVPGAAFLTRLQHHDLGFFYAPAWMSINNDPFYHLFWLFYSDCCNYTNYKNDEVAKLIQDFTLAPASKERDEASVKAQKIIVDEAPWVFVGQPQRIMVTRSNVKGFGFYSADGIVRYQYLFKQ